MARYKKRKNLNKQDESNETGTDAVLDNQTDSNHEKGNIKHSVTDRSQVPVMFKKKDRINLVVESQKIKNKLSSIRSPQVNKNVKAKLKIKLENRKKSASKRISKQTKILKNRNEKNVEDQKLLLNVNVESNENQAELEKAMDSDISKKSESLHENQNVDETIKEEMVCTTTDTCEASSQNKKLYKSTDSVDSNQNETNNEKNKRKKIKSRIHCCDGDENMSDQENIENDDMMEKSKNTTKKCKNTTTERKLIIQNEEISSKRIVGNASPINQYINENDDILCRICEQKLNNELKFFSGEPHHGHEEDLAIIDSRLLLFNGDEAEVSQEDTRAYNKITCFSVYCKNGHLCPFDSGLIERDINIFFSGYVKPIYSDDPSTENGVPGKDFGPIALWWITGFDIGEQPTVALSTELGDYILMEPSEEYKPFMKSVIVKILISKVVIENLIYEPNDTYENLLAKLQNTPLSSNLLTSITEDTLFQHAPFICDQVMSFDDTAKLNETLLITAPCMRRIIDLYGIVFEQPRTMKNIKRRKVCDYREDLLRRGKRAKSIASDLIDRLLPVNVVSSLKDLHPRNGCEACERCRRPSCENCPACARKSYDECVQRRCCFREIQEANDEDARDRLDTLHLKVNNSIDAYKSMIKTFTCFASKLRWLGLPDELIKEAGNVYYPGIELDGSIIKAGDYVYVRSVDPTVPAQVVRVAYLWRDNSGIARFHANYLWWGRDTVLGELANKKELFYINKCLSMPVMSAMEKVRVLEQSVPRNWDESVDSEYNRSYAPKNNFYCQKSYDPATGRFEDLLISDEAARLRTKTPLHRYCHSCESMEKQNESNTIQAFKLLEQTDDEKTKTFAVVTYKGEEYRVGSCVYLKPKSLYFKYPMIINRVKSSNPVVRHIDEEKYPEHYRKSENLINNSKYDMPAAFDIGYITKIFATANKFYIKVIKFYRPENTHRGEALNKSDIKMLFLSQEECTVAFTYVISKCYVAHAQNLNMSVEEWLSLGPDRFYFTESYKNKQFSNVDQNEFSKETRMLETPKVYPKVTKLKTLDIFAGCGGLMLGLQEAGIAKSCWAFGADKTAASTYKLNSPNTVVIVEDCEVILKKIVQGETKLNGELLPSQSDVDLLCATLPWQNFRATDAISALKISHLATFLSYCDYFRPAFFVLETDERLAKRNTIFKMFLTCIVGLGYQVAFDLLQIGCYGVPQNRKRCVLLGAAPGERLPKFPKNLHVFSKQLIHSNIVIDDKKYSRENDGTESAPYRTITIRDALSDLPAIEVGKKEELLNYQRVASNYFEKLMRRNMLDDSIVRDHLCKDLGPLVQARIMHIPTAAGSDWRNLPNIEVQMRDGRFTKKLVYNYNDLEADISTHGTLRGVCGCAAGKNPCDPRDRQVNTLIPWHLVHSGRKHLNWPGLYGRLSWDGFITGDFSNPEPLGTQGPVIHPIQPRIISVRECARCQGFPDDFTFGSKVSVYDKYHLIGQSASPLLGLALGREIARSSASTRK